jgi:hypothetical protein
MGARRIAALLLALTAFAAAGCGDDDSKDAAEGTGYEVELPGGWTQSDEQAEVGTAGIETDSVWFGPTVEAFRINGNVIIEGSLARGTRVRDYVEAGRRILRDARAREQLGLSDGVRPSKFEPLRTTSLDGDAAISTGYVNEAGGKRLRVKQVAAIRDGKAYNITYTAPEDRFADQLDEFDAIVASWKWD